jgi:hypothetical protein
MDRIGCTTGISGEDLATDGFRAVDPAPSARGGNSGPRNDCRKPFTVAKRITLYAYALSPISKVPLVLDATLSVILYFVRTSALVATNIISTWLNRNGDASHVDGVADAKSQLTFRWITCVPNTRTRQIVSLKAGQCRRRHAR